MGKSQLLIKRIKMFEFILNFFIHTSLEYKYLTKHILICSTHICTQLHKIYIIATPHWYIYYSFGQQLPIKMLHTIIDNNRHLPRVPMYADHNYSTLLCKTIHARFAHLHGYIFIHIHLYISIYFHFSTHVLWRYLLAIFYMLLNLMYLFLHARIQLFGGGGVSEGLLCLPGGWGGGSMPFSVKLLFELK